MAEPTARRREFGSIRRRVKDGKTVWQVRYTDGAGARQGGGTFPDERSAKTELRRIERSMDVGDYVDPRASRQPFRQVVDSWQSTRVNKRTGLSLSRGARERDDSHVAVHILPTFGDVPVNKIEVAHVRKWVASLADTGYAPATVGKMLQLVRQIFDAAVENGVIATNPATKVTTPRDDGRNEDEQRILTLDEVKTLHVAVDEPYRAAISVLAYEGLRPGELFALQRRDIDVHRGLLHVRRAVAENAGHLENGPLKTAHAKRTIPLMGDQLAHELEEHLGQFTGANATSWVFTSPSGAQLRPSNWRDRVWQQACARAGLGRWVTEEGDDWQPMCADCQRTLTDRRRRRCEHAGKKLYDGITPYALRHTAVSLWAAHNATPREIMKWAGHNDPRTALKIYEHVHPERGEIVAASVAAAISNAAPIPSAPVATFAPRHA